MTIPRPVPTQRQEETAESFLRAKDSMKYKAVIASFESLSMLDTLELRERLKEFSLFSSVVTGREISMQAADWAFLKGGLPGPRRFVLDTSALESRLPELQLWDVGLVQ